ncbi:T-cell surface antigen CD2-like [Rhinoderma darwinii]|uniref:T-cell surface antigen CD2-like n=1 Tax=Rhinoderma darwinii TaxID=43563 RepID=UPI003F663786
MVTGDVEIYTVLNRTVLLQVPQCQASDSDTVEWEEQKGKGFIRLAKWTGKPTYNDCNCTLYQNGSLSLKGPKKETSKYQVKIYASDGKSKCTKTVTVIVEGLVDQPVVNYICSNKHVTIGCSTLARNFSDLTLSWSSKSKTTRERSIMENIKERKAEVRCVARNRVSQSSTTLAVSCEWDIFLIISVAGGAVAFIIFIALVFYSVKYKPWRSHSRTEEDVEINRLQPSTLQLQLPEPPGQANTGSLVGGCQDDFTEQKPPTPHMQEPQESSPAGKKRKKPKCRRPPPLAPGETAPMSLSTTAPQQTRPSLPGNHPSKQAPRPQPRTKSKPPRQNRKRLNERDI